jgi:hypothetical protein
MNRYLLCLIVLCGCTKAPDEGARAKGKATAVVEIAAVMVSVPDVAPAPQPKPGVCPSCDGRGRSGDGLSPCNECGGDGTIEGVSTTSVPCDAQSSQLKKQREAKAVEQPADVPLIHPELTRVRPATPKVKRLAPHHVATLYVKNQSLLDAYRLPGESTESVVERFVKANPHLDPRKKKQYPGYPTRSKTGSYWNQNGHPPTREHLATVHGFDINWLRTLNQAQLNALHSDAHDAAQPTRRAMSYRVPSGGCPGGNCPSPSSGRFRLFR